MHLGAIRSEVIEFPATEMFRHELPVASADRAVSFMLPKDRLRTFERLAVEGGGETNAFHRLNILPRELGGILRACEVDASWHEVDQVNERAVESYGIQENYTNLICFNAGHIDPSHEGDFVAVGREHTCFW